MWLCRVMWSIYTYMFSFSGAHANRLHMEILTGQKRTTRVSKVLVPAAFCSLWWFLPWATPPPLASWSASPAPFWPLHLHQLVLLWWLPLRRESFSPSLWRLDLALCSPHTLSLGLPLTASLPQWLPNTFSEPWLIFRSSKSSMCLPAAHPHFSDPRAPQTHCVQNPYRLSPTYTPPFCIPLLGGPVLLPTWTVGLSETFLSALPPNYWIIIQCVLLKL